jgi:hypothetical protein
VATTEALSPDLQRIVEALKACREKYEISQAQSEYVVWTSDGGIHTHATFARVRDAEAYIDARCAEAMVRAIREPSEATVAAGLNSSWRVQSAAQHIVTTIWPAMCDAILGETQP